MTSPHVPDDGDALAVLDDPADAAAVATLPLGLRRAAPSSFVWSRLLASSGGGRFADFAARVGELCDLPTERAHEVLAALEDPTKWRPALAGIRLNHFRGGPRAERADCGLVRVAPGTAFPWHAHVGAEHSLFLAGAGRDHLGVVYRAGDELVLAAGSAHTFSTISDDELIVCVLHHGVDFTAKPPPP